MSYRLDRASANDIVQIAVRLITAPSGRDASRRLLETCAQSLVWVARGIDTSTPAGLWGVAASPACKSVGRFWMVAIKELDTSAELVTLSKLAVEEMFDEFDILENYVEVSRQNSIRLLEEVGFTVDAALPDEATGRVLHRIWLNRDDLTSSTNSRDHLNF